MTSGDALRFRTDERCPIEVAVAVHVLTRMLALDVRSPSASLKVPSGCG